MSLVSACTVGVPGFLLAMERSRERIQGSFLENVFRRALPGGVAVALCAQLAMMLTWVGWSPEVCSTLATWIAGMMGVTVLVRTCWPFDLMRGCVTAGALAMFVTCASALGKVFFLTGLRGVEWAALTGLTTLGVGLYIGTYFLEKRQRGRAKPEKMEKKKKKNTADK